MTLNGEKSTETQVVFSLHYGDSSKVLAIVVPDSKWLGLWHTEWPDGSVSDLANLSRIRDAAFNAAAQGRDWRLLRWRKPAIKPLGRAQRRPLVRRDENSAYGGRP